MIDDCIFAALMCSNWKRLLDYACVVAISMLLPSNHVRAAAFQSHIVKLHLLMCWISFVLVLLSLPFLFAFIYLREYYFHCFLNIEMFHWFSTSRTFCYAHHKKRARFTFMLYRVMNWIELSHGNEKAMLIYHKGEIMYGWCAAVKVSCVRIMAQNCSTFYFQVLLLFFHFAFSHFCHHHHWFRAVRNEKCEFQNHDAAFEVMHASQSLWSFMASPFCCLLLAH